MMLRAPAPQAAEPLPATALNVLLVYERKAREYENGLLLQEILTRRGCQVTLSQLYDASNFNLFGGVRYDVIIAPSLYADKDVYRLLARYGDCDRILNMQYEQVLSKKWETLGHHTPSGIATKAMHVCWGESTRQRLVNMGVPADNCAVTGAIQMDLLRGDIREDDTSVKVRLAAQFGLDANRPWTLFLSSFTYANISTQRLQLNENVAGTKLAHFVDTHTDARDRLIEWFGQLLEDDPEILFIYRPHPDELALGPIEALAERYANFHIIHFGSAKIWINASEQLYTWYSTTLVEAQYAGKSCAILRPTELDDNFDSVLLKKGRFIQTYEAMRAYHFASDKEFALDPADVEDYYHYSDEPVFQNLADLILSDRRTPFRDIRAPLGVRLSNLAKNTVIFGVYLIYRTGLFDLSKDSLGSNAGFLKRWLIEMHNQFVKQEEHDAIRTTILARVEAWYRAR